MSNPKNPYKKNQPQPVSLGYICVECGHIQLHALSTGCERCGATKFIKKVDIKIKPKESR